MLQLIEDFPKQMKAALRIGEAATLSTPLPKNLKNVVVCGLGGSGIGGDFIAELFRTELSIPILVTKGYFLPAYVDHSSLLILCSYSGNTEETVHIAAQAETKGLKPVCVTSGGKLATLAKENHWNLILIPPGLPPRACFGYSATQLFFILHHAGIIDDTFKKTLEKSADLLLTEQTDIIERSKKIADGLLHHIVIVYAEDNYESAALRLKQQINENSKMYCWYNVIPEVNHNELVGWKQPAENLAVIFLRSKDEYPRNTERIRYKKEVISKLTDTTFEVFAKGSNLIERHFYLIHFGDWLSYHLAALQGIDAVEVDVITRLKQKLESFGNF